MQIKRIPIILLTCAALAACGSGHEIESPAVSSNEPNPNSLSEFSQKVREKAGFGIDLGVFVDRLNVNEQVTSVRLCAGVFVDSLQLTTNQRVLPLRGGPGGICQVFDLAANETITQIFGGGGGIIDRLGFVTSTGRILGPMGGAGGRPFSMSVPKAPGMVFRGVRGAVATHQGIRLLGQINLIGDFTGGDGGAPFIDRMLPDERVTAVTLCYVPNGFVQSVQLRTNLGLRARHGTDGPDMRCNTTQLAADEYIVELSGRADTYLNALGYTTSNGRTIGPFGGPGGVEFNQTVTAGNRFVGWYGRSGSWMDKIGLMTATVGEVGSFTFVDQLPGGARISGVEVCVSDGFGSRVVRSLQGILDTGARLPLNGGRRQTGLNTVCSTVTFAANEFVVEMFGGAGAAIDRVGFRLNTGREFGPYGGPGGEPFILRNPNTSALLGFAGRFGYDGTLGALDFAAPDIFAPKAIAGAEAKTQGWWGDMGAWPLNAIHITGLGDGRFLSYGTDASGTQGGQFIYDVWTPSLGLGANSHLTLVNTTGTDIFCSGQTLLPNGDVLLAGGDNRQASVVGGYNGYNKGVADANIFSPKTNALVPTAKMNKPRWYATQTTLASGRILVTGGFDSFGNGVAEPELYTPGVGWKLLPGAANVDAFHRNYPRVFVAPTTGVGDQVYVIPTDTNRIYRLNVDSNNGQGSIVDTTARLPANHSWKHPSAMIAPGKVLLHLEDGSTVTMQIPRTANALPVMAEAGRLSQVRNWSNFVTLPTGDVLAVGGSMGENDLTGVAYHAEIWSRASRVWRTVASEMRPRLYHSTALLMPDGRVLSTGGGAPGPVVNLNAQIYSPPYLYNTEGNGDLAPRPSVAFAQGQVPYGGAVFTVQTPQAAEINRVSLTRLGSATHSYGYDSRFQFLAINSRTASTLSIKGPTDATEMPPGKYLLTLINGKGVPSVSQIVTLSVQ